MENNSTRRYLTIQPEKNQWDTRKEKQGFWYRTYLEEDAGGAEEEPGLAGGLGLQADAVAHEAAHWLAPLLGHTAGHTCHQSIIGTEYPQGMGTGSDSFKFECGSSSW